MLLFLLLFIPLYPSLLVKLMMIPTPQLPNLLSFFYDLPITVTACQGAGCSGNQSALIALSPGGRCRNGS